MKETSESVYPGKQIAVIEEFLPGPGTYTSDDGFVRSVETGVATKDLKNRKVSVATRKRVGLPRIGDEVMGVVISLSGVWGNITIESINGVPWKSAKGVLYPTRRVRKNERQFDPGDFIVGVIDSDINRTYHVSIRDGRHGVILGLCQQCGATLRRKRGPRPVLRCGRCGEERMAKISGLYGRLT
ncbi:MAG: exosome complex RNA-binding protein Csl4 [Candidatus Geothermarchaeales archaeon]